MNCLDFRRHVLADPYNLTEEAKRHREACATCGRFYADTLVLDGDIRRALKVDPPEGLAARFLLNQSLRKARSQPRRWYYPGIAASVVAILVFASLRFFTGPAALDRAVVSHIEKELGMVQRMTGPVRQPTIDDVLNEINVNAKTPLRHVVFAANCIIEGELVAHLVVEDANRQYTVILIPHRALDQPVRIEQQRWRGVIKPNGAGTLAVLTNAAEPNMVEVNRIVREFDQAIVKRGVRI